jgi:ankyrin repeat protein
MSISSICGILSCIRNNAALHEAVKNVESDKHIEQIIRFKNVLRYNFSFVDVRDRAGWTPLHHAVEKNLLSVCEALVDTGAKVDVSDIFGLTPLLYAARFGFNSIVCLLLDNGANLEHKDSNGMSALYWATVYNHRSTCSLLLEKGAKLDTTNNYGHSPLILSIDKDCDVEICAMLIDKGASVLQNQSGLSPLHWAATYGTIDICQHLINEGADLLATDTQGRTPIDVACSSEMKEFLLDALASQDNAMRHLKNGRYGNDETSATDAETEI